MPRNSPTPRSHVGNRLRLQSQRIRIFPSTGKLPNQYKEFQPPHRVRMGIPRPTAMASRLARKLGHLQCPPEHVDPGRTHHHQRRPAANTIGRRDLVSLSSRLRILRSAGQNSAGGPPPTYRRTLFPSHAVACRYVSLPTGRDRVQPRLC